VIWSADNLAFDFTVKFQSKQPFSEKKWKQDGEETGKEVQGTIKSHGNGKHDYFYSVTVGDNVIGPAGGPELIVDGGEGVFDSDRPKPP
jgi:hypothetical protein